MAGETACVEKKRLPLSQIVTPARLAADRGCDIKTARRWLERLDAQCGGKLLMRTSDLPRARVYTTIARIRRADPTWLETREILESDIERLEKKIEAVRDEARAGKPRMRELLARLAEMTREGQSAPIEGTSSSHL